MTRVLSVRHPVGGGDHAGLGRGIGGEHVAHGHVRPTKRDRDHAIGGGDELAHPRAVPRWRGSWSPSRARLAAVLALFLVKVIFIDRLRSHFQLFPLIKNSDVLAVAPWILLAAFVVAVIAGTVGMRKFLDV